MSISALDTLLGIVHSAIVITVIATFITLCATVVRGAIRCVVVVTLGEALAPQALTISHQKLKHDIVSVLPAACAGETITFHASSAGVVAAQNGNHDIINFISNIKLCLIRVGGKIEAIVGIPTVILWILDVLKHDGDFRRIGCSSLKHFGDFYCVS